MSKKDGSSTMRKRTQTDIKMKQFPIYVAEGSSLYGFRPIFVIIHVRIK